MTYEPNSETIKLALWEDGEEGPDFAPEPEMTELDIEYYESKTREVVRVEPLVVERFVFLEGCKFRPKEPRVSKAEKRREKMPQVAKVKSPYSVFEDMVILTTFCDAQNADLSVNEKIDAVMEDLPARSFESLRERYRKWLKDLTEDDVDQIIRYCDENYDKCESYMIKVKKSEQAPGIALEFVPTSRRVAAEEAEREAAQAQQPADTREEKVSSPDKEELRYKIKRRLESITGSASQQQSATRPSLSLLEKEIPIPIILKLEEPFYPIPAILGDVTSKKFSPRSSEKRNAAPDDRTSQGRQKLLPKQAEREKVTKERADLFFRRPQDSDLLLGKRREHEDLAVRAASFKAAIRTGKKLKPNALVLCKLLKFLSQYHQVPLASVLAGLDDSQDLSLHRLRTKLCNDTVVKGLLGHRLVPLK